MRDHTEFKIMTAFIEFLQNIELLRKTSKTMVVINPLVSNHMIREENIIFQKLLILCNRI